jgi:hypothetical protein
MVVIYSMDDDGMHHDKYDVLALLILSGINNIKVYLLNKLST